MKILIPLFCVPIDTNTSDILNEIASKMGQGSLESVLDISVRRVMEKNKKGKLKTLSQYLLNEFFFLSERCLKQIINICNKSHCWSGHLFFHMYRKSKLIYRIHKRSDSCVHSSDPLEEIEQASSLHPRSISLGNAVQPSNTLCLSALVNKLLFL